MIGSALVALVPTVVRAGTDAAPNATPTPAQSAQAAQQAALERDFAELARQDAAERARLTPEVRAAAKALAEKDYPDGRSAVAAVLQGPHRAPGNAARDGQRHPQETLELFGFAPDLTVLEYGPGEGWYTEILAPALARRGKLYVTTPDPDGPKDQRPTLYAQRTKLFLERLPEAYGKVEPIVVDGKSPKLPLDGEVDLILVMRGLHGMVNNGTLDAWLAEFHRALKPGGVLGVEQHRAAPGAVASETSKQGYLPEAFVIEQVEKAGFKLADKSEVNANPKDTRDHPEGVWTLPPTLRLGERDRDKYLAIGESDRMTLKFVKVADDGKDEKQGAAD
ncbi:MAG TPA: methyltransferase domain-containing protein [Candidatus Binatia bacterium]